MLTDRVSMGILTGSFPPETVDELVRAHGVREQRRRELPADVMVYFTIAMWLWRGSGYVEVLKHMSDALRVASWKGPATEWMGEVANSFSITKARKRIGWQVMEDLFHSSVEPVAEPGTGQTWQGLSPVAIDGATLDVADSLADIFDAHIYSFAWGEVVDGNGVPNSGIGEFEADRSFVEMGPDERARYMQFLMGDDETAGRIVNSVDAYQQVESVAYLETGNPASAARGSAQLQGLLERSLWLESESRGDDLGDTVDRKEQIAGFVMSEAGDLSKNIPVIGTAVSKGMDLGEESIVNAVIDGDYDVSPRFPVYTSDQSTERTFQMEILDFLAQKGPQEFEEDTQRGDFRTLVDSGVVSIERDGQTLKASDIGSSNLMGVVR